MINLKRVIAGVMLATLAGVGYAQKLTESVTVEGKYTPEIISADRLALLPATVTLNAPESNMAYDRKGVAADFSPDALNMPATGWRAKKLYDSSKGYVDFRLGSWLNSSLSAGFAAIRNDDTQLNVYLQHNSTSLWQAWKGDEEKNIQAADKRFRYDETIGADLSHRLLGIGTISADLRYHLGYFNYYGTDQGGKADEAVKAPTQTLNDVYARVGWKGLEHERLSYAADADVRYFGYRAYYLPSIINVYPRQYVKTKGARETVINVGGDVAYSLSDEAGNGSKVGIALRYSGVINSEFNDVNRVEATPAYTLMGRNYSLRLGANLAVVGNGETKFRVAPDVRFGVRKGIMAFSATIGGGTHLRTLAWQHMMDYYSDPGLGCYEAAYSPLDAHLAFQLNPGGRWTVGIEGAWRTTLNESLGGWYQEELNNGSWWEGLLSSSYPQISDDYAWERYRTGGRIHGFSLSVNAGYEFCRYFSLNGKATWHPQDGSKGFLNGFDRPEFTADLSAESSPIDRLSLKLDYRLRAKRWLLPGNMSRLDLAASYRVTDKISVGADLNNLLNRHEEILPGLPLEGFNVACGFQIVF